MTKPVTVQTIADYLNVLAPADLAEPWDHTGLLIGSPDQPVRRVLVSLDADLSAINAAVQHQAELMICHHPLIFSPLSSLRIDRPNELQCVRLIQEKISLIAAHTNLDAAEGGTADCLAAYLLQGHEISVALQPCAVYGRLADISEPVLLSDWRREVAVRLGSSGCRLNTGHDRLIRRVVFWPGAFSEDAIEPVVQARADLVICGEVKHHVNLALADFGVALMDVGHDVSERPVLRPLADTLQQVWPQISFAVHDGIAYNGIAY
ncbi:MAG: Nif3-like dinuclear metal center hexameric protein [Clostridia bacterium]|nr:Nif3-like dinuclear metal center hexameric protein [Eubacteriales bacterium]MDD4462180.1 Nif3-like dinuclear metal center hexameric protein [Eubacteriales bacterium]NCC49117.1 Nif3-like dinuclear metal center hexameric protein [Clostridia bacterium]